MTVPKRSLASNAGQGGAGAAIGVRGERARSTVSSPQASARNERGFRERSEGRGAMSSAAVGALRAASVVPGFPTRRCAPTRATASVAASTGSPPRAFGRGVSPGCSSALPRCLARRPRRTARLDRGASCVVRAQAGEPSRWVKRANGERADPISGALHQAQGLRERLAEVANGARGFIAPKESAANDNDAVEDWEHWTEVFDRVDDEDAILAALEVRPLLAFRRRRPWVFHRPARRARGVHPDPSREDSGRFPPRRAARRAGSRHAPAPTTRARPRPPPRRAAAVFSAPPPSASRTAVPCASSLADDREEDERPKRSAPPRRPAPPRPSTSSA